MSFLSDLLHSIFGRRPQLAPAPVKPPARPPGVVANPVNPPSPVDSLTAVNAARANYGPRGIGQVTFDAAMMNVSAANNIQQAIHGIGHYVEAAPGLTSGQCAGEGYSDAGAVVKAWLDDPPHREILLNPAYHFAGLAIDPATRFATLTMRA